LNAQPDIPPSGIIVVGIYLIGPNSIYDIARFDMIEVEWPFIKV